jgi:hypothetical protein
VLETWQTPRHRQGTSPINLARAGTSTRAEVPARANFHFHNLNVPHVSACAQIPARAKIPAPAEVPACARFVGLRALVQRHSRARTIAHATFLRVQEVRTCGFLYGKSAFKNLQEISHARTSCTCRQVHHSLSHRHSRKQIPNRDFSTHPPLYPLYVSPSACSLDYLQRLPLARMSVNFPPAVLPNLPD